MNKLKYISILILIQPLFAQGVMSGVFSPFKLFFTLMLFIFLTGLFYVILKLFLKDDRLHLSLFLSVAASFLILFMLFQSPFGKLFIEVILPFMLFTIFFLILVYVFFSALGIKFGTNENEEGFIHIVSPIAMWVGIGILLISFLAALKMMGYKIIDKMLQPSILGILVFFIALGIMIMTLEEEEKK